MARVLIDVHLFGASWFSPILKELREAEKVTFSYSSKQMGSVEHERTLKAKRFFQLMGQMKKRCDADPKEVAKHIAYLERQSSWRQEKDCDDPHIFAIVYEKPTRYVFSEDADMANCRRLMNRVVDKRYCDFRVITSEATYQYHKPDILA